jgi:predicted ATP-grasp superfamily ATP-dependent carboligase
VKNLLPSNQLKKIKSFSDKPIAFILGKYPTTGLGVSRCLGRQEIPVIWIDSNPKQVGFLSTYCTGLVSPQPQQEEDNYIEFLINIGEQLHKKGILYPIGDIELYIILKHKPSLKQYYHIPTADLKVTELFLNKQKLYKILDQYKINHPKTYFIKNQVDLELIRDEINYPCIIKPAHSIYFRKIYSAKFFIIQSKQELIQRYNKIISNKQEVFIQEFIPGDATYKYGFNSYYKTDFTPIGIFSYRRIREWPPGSGNGVFIEQVHVPEFETTVTSLIKKIKYFGIVDTEFKKDPRTGLFNLIEINPRCWMQISFPLTAGINFPYIIYLDSIGKEIMNNVIDLQKKKWLFMFQDLSSSLRSFLHGELFLKDWYESYTGKKEYAIYAPDDPLPFLFYIFATNLSHYKYREP